MFRTVIAVYRGSHRRSINTFSGQISQRINVKLSGIYKLDVCLSVHRCICVQKKNQLYATEWFIALIIRSTCFGHFYAHHQELETICVLLPPMVRIAWLLVVGGPAGQQAMRPVRVMLHDSESCNIPLTGRIACCPAPDPDNQQSSTAHHRR